MLIQASYNELNDIISQKTQMQGLSLAYCDTDTTKVSFMLNILGLSPSVSAKVKIVSIEGNLVTVEIDAGKLAIVNLEAIPDLKPVLETMTVNDLSFTEDRICLDTSLK